MKKWFLILALVFWSIPLWSTTLTGTIKKPDGTRFNGKIRMTLSHPAQDSSASMVVVPQTVEFRVANGALPSTAAVAGNDVLRPLYTYYWTQYYDSYNRLVMENPFYISGSSYDLGAAQPTTITTTNISFVGVPAIGSCAAGTYMTTVGTAGPTCAAASLTAGVSGILPVANGGTGLASGTQRGLPYFATTTTIASTAAGTATQVLHGSASGAPSFSVVNLATDVSTPFITATAALDFPDTATLLSADLTITATGAAVGDVVMLGVPNAAVTANTCFTAWVSATNTVTVRFNNYSAGNSNPDSATFKVIVIH